MRDEAGEVWQALQVEVGHFATEMLSMSNTATTLSFSSIPGDRYEIMWVDRLGGEWQAAASVTAETSRTTLVVPLPDSTSATGFLRIVLK